MDARIKSIEPKLDGDNNYIFVVKVEIDGKSMSVGVNSQTILDFQKIRVVIAQNAGYLLKPVEQKDWEKQLAHAKQPEPRPDPSSELPY